MASRLSNPFRYGDLALDEAFTDREQEVEELRSDALNGQNVVVFAPRRYGKSSLVWRVVQQLIEEGALVAQVDLMKTPTKEKLAEKLAEAVYELASTLFKVRERAVGLFRGLRVAPVMTIDPNDASVGFSFAGGREEDVDATMERLLQLPAQLAAEQRRRAVLVFDEFQEVTEIDERLPALMRSIFQEQPEVAHVYLGSKRSMMEAIFNDENEPFWRSAKQIELDVIAPVLFRPYITSRFESTQRHVEDDVVTKVLEMTRGHPYGTQELCYFLWEEVAEGETATLDELDAAVANVLRSENAHFTRIWEKAAKSHRLVLQALASEPLQPFTDEYRRRHGLPAPSTTQKALATLVEDELVVKERRGDYRIAEPFFADWVLRYGS